MRPHTGFPRARVGPPRRERLGSRGLLAQRGEDKDGAGGGTVDPCAEDAPALAGVAAAGLSYGLPLAASLGGVGEGAVRMPVHAAGALK